jgi:hypothetical protein
MKRTVFRTAGCPGQSSLSLDPRLTATTMYRDMGMTYWLEKSEAEMWDLA